MVVGGGGAAVVATVSGVVVAGIVVGAADDGATSEAAVEGATGALGVAALGAGIPFEASVPESVASRDSAAGSALEPHTVPTQANMTAAAMSRGSREDMCRRYPAASHSKLDRTHSEGGSEGSYASGAVEISALAKRPVRTWHDATCRASSSLAAGPGNNSGSTSSHVSVHHDRTTRVEVAAVAAGSAGSGSRRRARGGTGAARIGNGTADISASVYGCNAERNT